MKRWAPLVVLLLAGTVLSGCVAEPPEVPRAPQGEIRFERDDWYTLVRTPVLIEGHLGLDAAPNGGVSLNVTIDQGWTAQVASLEPTEDPRQHRFVLNLTPTSEVRHNKTANVTLEAHVDGAILTSGITVSIQKEFSLPNSLAWDIAHLNILIVPPPHGAIANTHQGALPYGPEGALGGLYLDATLHVLEDWRWALDRFAENHTDLAWVANITWDVQVIPEHLVTPDDIQRANILKFYPETTFPILGAAVYAAVLTGSYEPGCIAYSTMWQTYGSITYEDMYALAGHELLHCFGMSHPDAMQPIEDIMAYEWWPIPALRCPSNLNVRAAAGAFVDAIAGASQVPNATVFEPEYEQYCSPYSDPRDLTE